MALALALVGIVVAFGVLLSLTVATGVSTPGLKSLVMGLAFGMSFVLILVSGVSLITADMAAGLIVSTMLDGVASWVSSSERAKPDVLARMHRQLRLVLVGVKEWKPKR